MSSNADFVEQMYQAGLTAGLSDAAARVMAAQAAHESNFGSAAPNFNYFGIKAGSSWTGATQRLLTTERQADGSTVRVHATFRAYATAEEAIADRVEFMSSRFPDFNQAATVADALDALQNGAYGAYYTDDRATYEAAINNYNTLYLGGTPVPPENIGVIPLPQARPTDTLAHSATEGDTGEAGMSVTPSLNTWAQPGMSMELGPAAAADDALMQYLAPQYSPIQLADSPLAGGAGALSFPPLMSPDEVAKTTAAMKVAVEAPTPMPGRPAGIDAMDAPLPAPAPLVAPPQGTAAPVAAAPQTIKVGKHNYTVGDTFDQGGQHYVVTPDGIESSRIPTGEPTIMSGVVGQVIGDAVTSAIPTVQSAMTDAGTAIQTNATQLGDNAKQAGTGLVNTVFGGLSSLFGGPPPADGITVQHGGYTATGRPIAIVDGSQWFPEVAPIPESQPYVAPPARPWKPQEIDIALPTSTGNKAMDDALSSDPLLLQDIHDKKDDATVAAEAPSMATVSPTGVVKTTTAQTSVEPLPSDVVPKTGNDGGYELPGAGPSTWADFASTMKVEPVASQPAPKPTTSTVTEVVANPEYQKWFDVFGSQASTDAATTKLQDIHDTQDDAEMKAQSSAPAATPIPPAPPKTIVQTKTVTVAAPKPATAATTAAVPTSQQPKSKAGPAYVDAKTGAALSPYTINYYDTDPRSPTYQTWQQRTGYKPTDEVTAAPATSSQSSGSSSAFTNPAASYWDASAGGYTNQ